MMKLTFCGAAQCVTGSCYLLELEGKQILIDCGMQQGREEMDNSSFPFDPQHLSCVLVTHAHIDHCGRLPLLIRRGYRGPIIATGLTGELLEVLLRDSAEIQASDIAWKNQKHRRAGRDAEEPLFTIEHVNKALRQLKTYPYGERFAVIEGVEARFIDAGHILGSAMIELWWQESGAVEKIVFSGDIGNAEMPIICDPTLVDEAAYVVMESTCGDQNHQPQGDYKEALAHLLDETFARGGNVLIPAAAVGRSQEVLYHLHQLKLERKITSLPDFPVYVDSHLAKEMLEVYHGNLADYIDKAALEVVQAAGTVLDFPGLFPLITSEESRRLNQDKSPKVIIAAASMCEAGRIRHHLKHNLYRPECTVVLLGSQRHGTLGSILLNGAKRVKLFGDEIAVKARITSLPVRSSHADQSALLQWIQHFRQKPRQVFVTHGDAEVIALFTALLAQNQIPAHGPRYLEQYDLSANQQISEGQAIPAAKGRTYHALQYWSQQLQTLVEHSQNQEPAQTALLTQQIKTLVETWQKETVRK